MDRIWPDEDVKKGANRLSVALSTVRSVLDPDRRFAADHFLTGTRETVSLNLANVEVDIETFLGQARAGLTAFRSGDVERGEAMMSHAETLYVGDFLEDYPYADWATGTREEARASYLEIVAVLADEDLEHERYDLAVRRLLRLIERDHYDETAHLKLVRTMNLSGRHGAARRLYAGYEGRMAELDIEPAPFPL